MRAVEPILDGVAQEKERMGTMNLFQVLTYRSTPSLCREPFGPIAMVRCEGRCCPDRSAPVFVVGALLLCSTCRDFRNRFVRDRIAALRRAA